MQPPRHIIRINISTRSMAIAILQLISITEYSVKTKKH